MAKNRRRKRSYDEVEERPLHEVRDETQYTTTYFGPVFEFFRKRSTRETVESIIVAVALAMAFRTFCAEAYIIPTGSMAPTLQGQHMDVVCDHCGYRYLTGASEDNSTIPPGARLSVIATFCPFCRSELVMKPLKEADHRSFAGDRIVVNKFMYDFDDPKRFDVIVFKNPNDGKMNFIKRLVGLPEEKLLIENGDIFSLDEKSDQTFERTIIRKPAHKLKAMMQIVDDTDFVAQKLADAGWPVRWQTWSSAGAGPWNTNRVDGTYRFSIEPVAEKAFLRYRHLYPSLEDWDAIEGGKAVNLDDSRIQGRLISDYYCYDDRLVEQRRLEYRPPSETRYPGNHWVGDIAVEANVDNESPTGELFLDLVEGGVHFELRIDLASGKASLSNSAGYPFLTEKGQIVENPSAETPVKGKGNFDILFANADDQLSLWVDGIPIEMEGSRYSPAARVNPRWSPEDHGDAEPAGIAATNASLTVSRLRIWRDIYYTSVIGGTMSPRNETGTPVPLIQKVFSSPQLWESGEGQELFEARFRDTVPMFELLENQFLPMGDNSPESSDGRVWDGPHFLPGELLIGRALFIYWPHAKNKPVPFFPQFERMGPIQ